MKSKKLRIALVLSSMFFLTGCRPSVGDISFSFPFLIMATIGFNLWLGKTKKNIPQILLVLGSITFFTWAWMFFLFSDLDNLTLLAFVIMLVPFLLYTFLFYLLVSKKTALKKKSSYLPAIFTITIFAIVIASHGNWGNELNDFLEWGFCWPMIILLPFYA